MPIQQKSSRQNRRKQCLLLGAAATLSGLGAAGAVRLQAAAPNANPNAKPPEMKSAEMSAAAIDKRPLTEDEKILQLLNRVGFGPRPGDVARVKEMGIDHYIDLQLHPEKIDDSAVERKLSRMQYLNASGAELAEMYGEQTSAFRQAQQLRKQVISEQNKQNPQAASGVAAQAAAAPGEDTQKGKRQLVKAAPTEEQQKLVQLQRDVRQKAIPVIMAQRQLANAKVIRAVESERQLQEVMVDFWGNHFNIDVRKNACGAFKVADDRDVIRKYALGKFRDLLGASAHSPAMLVYLDNFQSVSSPSAEMIVRERMGARFDQLPPARKQALLRQAQQRMDDVKKRGKGAARGINENYAREIMELHTLGVDGGYTQKDVQEVARCFTGWGLQRPKPGPDTGSRDYVKMGGEFEFHPFQHDSEAKTVLGQTIPAGGGEKDGEMVLDILASHPATMKHVSWQLCQRLVSDDPPASLVNKCVATWKKTDGDIREIVRTIITSPEFNSRMAYRQKIKSPFEFAVSSVRALGGTLEQPTLASIQRVKAGNPKKGNALESIGNNTLIGQVSIMGEPIFQYQAPTGYPEDSRKWVSSGALISRLNYSLALTNGKMIDISLPNLEQTVARSGDPGHLVNNLAQQIVQTGISPTTRATLIKEVGPAPDAASTAADVTTVSRLAALMLGSPEFQRR